MAGRATVQIGKPLVSPVLTIRRAAEQEDALAVEPTVIEIDLEQVR